MNNPIVSVVIPAYNCQATLKQAIDSALIQDVQLEIIVVDDCSPDDIKSVVAEYSCEVVKYLRNEKNLGAAESRNVGVLAARGEYIAFLDADDYWEKEKLKKQLSLIKSTGYVMCATARELMKPDGSLTNRIIKVKEVITYKDLLKHNPINCSSVLIKTSVAREFPMHNADSHEDYIMWLEVLGKYSFACAINEPLLKYRLSNTGKSGNKFKSAAMTYKAYRYAGIGKFKSYLYFCNYVFNGIKKYYFG